MQKGFSGLFQGIKDTMGFAPTISDLELFELYKSSLPPMKEIKSVQDRRTLLVKKIRMCSRIFDFEASETDPELLAKKTEALKDLVDSVSSFPDMFTGIFSDRNLKLFLEKNLERPIPPSAKFVLGVVREDPSWPHLQLVYGFVHKLVQNAVDESTQPSVLKELVRLLVGRLVTEDPNEWVELNKVMLCLFNKNDNIKAMMRSQVIAPVMKVFYKFSAMQWATSLSVMAVFGVIAYPAVLLTRQMMPMVTSASQFSNNGRRLLFSTLLPLYKEEWIDEDAFKQLNTCVSNFVRKDPVLCVDVIDRMLLHWPDTNSHLAIASLSNVLKFITMNDKLKAIHPVYNKFAECLANGKSKDAHAVLLELVKRRHLGIIKRYPWNVAPLLIPVLAQLDNDCPLEDREMLETLKPALFKQQWVVHEFMMCKMDKAYAIKTPERPAEEENNGPESDYSDSDEDSSKK